MSNVDDELVESAQSSKAVTDKANTNKSAEDSAARPNVQRTSGRRTSAQETSAHETNVRKTQSLSTNPTRTNPTSTNAPGSNHTSSNPEPSHQRTAGFSEAQPSVTRVSEEPDIALDRGEVPSLNPNEPELLKNNSLAAQSQQPMPFPVESTHVAGAPILYVGLGASAGGLEALCDFFDCLPCDTEATFIIVQHLSPDFKSLMDELLGKHTSMPVQNVVDGVKALPNSVYLIPARKNVMLAEGRLYLADQMQNQGVNLPIDVFFKSLAESARDRSVAIILSGTGSDGSRGLKAIKESGGLVLVQEPESAKFDGMPISAVQTGLADFTLTSSELAENLARYSKHPRIVSDAAPLKHQLEQDSDLMQRIFELLRQEGYIDFSHYKATTVARRIEQRIGINQLHTLREYLNLLEESVKEIQTLGRELLINVTRFFRDTDAFEFVEQRIVSRIVEKAGEGQELRIWVAGCSTGEEPYSLAILFDEAIKKSDKNLKLKVFATDVDSEAIAEASSGQFSNEIVNELSQDRLDTYFQEIHGGYEVRTDLRKLVVFAHHNMITDPPFSNIDFISCRNVLIYFQHAAQKKVLAGFHFSLKADAPIFFGSSESIGELKDYFEQIDDRSRIYKKISNLKLPVGSVLRQPIDKSVPRLGIPPVSTILRSYRGQSARETSFDHVKDNLLNSVVGSCIILNGDCQAVHVYGDGGKYMNAVVAGRVSTRIQDMILPELSMALDTALSKARNTRATVLYENMPVEIADSPGSVDMRTEYFEQSKNQSAFYAVTISDSKLPGDTRKNIQSFNISEQASQRIRDLENDILHKQEHLQATNEELETTNEELQSANEELMSSNEELQSTNEELQSVNEELFTVNSEFQQKISELTVANDDLDNVLSSTAIGIVFLDENCRIRRLTEVARRFFNTLPSDIGRPLDHISHDLKYPELFEDIRRVMSNLRSIRREVFSLAGEFVQVKLIPYKSSDTPESKGCIISVTDLSHRTLSDQEQQKKQQRKKLASENRGQTGHPVSVLNVLIVDDNDEDRYAMRSYLESIPSVSISTYEADSVNSGLDSLDNFDIDICLLDYRLDDENASDFIREAKRRRHSVPVILVSGVEREAIKRNMDLKDESMYISKAELSPLVLELSIKHALGSSIAATADI